MFGRGYFEGVREASDMEGRPAVETTTAAAIAAATVLPPDAPEGTAALESEQGESTPAGRKRKLPEEQNHARHAL
eukprot:g32326.t1